MNTVLYELKGIKAFVYLDDVIVFGRTVEEHNVNLKRILEALRKHNLKLQPPTHGKVEVFGTRDL